MPATSLPIQIRDAVILAVSLAASIAACAVTSPARANDGFHGAFFRGQSNVSRSGSSTSLAATSPRSQVLDAEGRTYVFHVERITHAAGKTRELALATHQPGAGWDSLTTPVGPWDGAASTDPTCAVDQGGGLHLVWIDRQESKPQVFGQVFELRQGRFSEPLRLSDGTAPAADPAIAVDPEGWLHVAWSEIASATSVVRHRAAAAGSLWGAIDTVPSPAGVAAYGPDLVTDTEGTLHLTWEWGATHGVGIGYARWTHETGWSAPERVVDAASGIYAQTPVIAAQSDGAVWVAWAVLEADGTGSLAARRRLPDGRWEAPLVIAGGAPEVVSPAIAVDIWDVVHLVWEEATEPDDQGEQTTLVVYSAISGTPPAPITPRPLTPRQSGPNRTPMLAVDDTGRILVSWIDESEGSGDLIARFGVSGFARPDR